MTPEPRLIFKEALQTPEELDGSSMCFSESERRGCGERRSFIIKTHVSAVTQEQAGSHQCSRARQSSGLRYSFMYNAETQIQLEKGT